MQELSFERKSSSCTRCDSLWVYQSLADIAPFSFWSPVHVGKFGNVAVALRCEEKSLEEKGSHL